jgi:hypothetical protein
MHKRPRSHPRSSSWMQETQQQVKQQMRKNPHLGQVQRLTRRQQQSLLRPAQRQRRRL